MSEKSNVVGAVTPDDIRKYVAMFLPVVVAVTKWMPENVQKFISLGTSLLSQDWAVGLLVYLINTLENKQLTEKQVAKALENFAASLEKGEGAPIKWDLQ